MCLGILASLALYPCVYSLRQKDDDLIGVCILQVLKAVETKSKEEIEHERLREPLVEAVGDAKVRKQIHDHRLGTLIQSRDNYNKTKR